MYSTPILSVILALLAIVRTAVAFPLNEAVNTDSELEVRKPKASSKNCRTVVKGYLIGFDQGGNTLNFHANSKHEVAYDPKSTSKLFVNFQNCPLYPPVHEDDSIGYNGRIYVPSYGACITNSNYKAFNSNFYLNLTPCKQTTSHITDDQHWRYYPGTDTSLNYVYWVADPSRATPGCDGDLTYSYFGNNEQIPFTRNGHNGQVELGCSNGLEAFPFFIGSSKCTDETHCEAA